jgi:plasmid stabilization system protein ParE
MEREVSVRNSTCEDQINMAVRELSAFIRAVTELFGPEQARLAAEDWLDESELLMDRPALASNRDWRSVTVAASARLADRVTIRRTPASSNDSNASPILTSNCFGSALLV